METNRFRLTPEEREKKIQRVIWTFRLEGIEISREQAEAALDQAMAKTLPDI